MNKIPKILFLHGREGTPEGSKVTHLRDCGYRVIAPVLPKDSLDLSIKRAQNCFDAFLPDIIIGSSRGGAVACSIKGSNTPKILIAPAYNKFRCQINDIDDSTIVLHCPDDDIVSFEDSKNLVEAFNVDLRSCGICHRMKDPDALKNLITAIEEQLSK